MTFAWLIEVPGPAYWDGNCFASEEGVVGYVTRDHNAAVRFARKQDAEAVLASVRFQKARAVEHGWDD